MPRPNVLYLISDDMRASWGTYGQPVHTPNIDALAERGLLFSRSYCQISVCAPSRMSFMHSRRPGSFDVYNFIDTAPTETISVPRHFRDAGYLTLGLGKGFHQGADGKPVGGCWNANNTWSDEPGYPCFPFELTPCPHGGPGGGHCVLNDEQIYDFHLAKATASYLRFAAEQRRRHGTPFFVLAGFKKPHAPWSAPQRHYDQYNPSAIALPKHPTLPRGAPLVAWSRQLDVRLANGTSFRYDAHTPVPSWVMQDQRRAYYASVSYVDELIGQLLEVVRSEGVQGETIIALHADHGYHLGEHGEWEKKSNFDLVVRVPLLLCVPWLPASHGRRTAALTELIDVGPTLARLSGLPALPGTGPHNHTVHRRPMPVFLPMHRRSLAPGLPQVPTAPTCPFYSASRRHGLSCTPSISTLRAPMRATLPDGARSGSSATTSPRATFGRWATACVPTRGDTRAGCAGMARGWRPRTGTVRITCTSSMITGVMTPPTWTPGRTSTWLRRSRTSLQSSGTLRWRRFGADELGFPSKKMTLILAGPWDACELDAALLDAATGANLSRSHLRVYGPPYLRAVYTGTYIL